MSEFDNIVCWGGLYRVKHNRWNDAVLDNDQIYRQAVPVHDKDGNLWMQDTYQIKSIGWKKNTTQYESAIERLISLQDSEIGYWVINHSKTSFYHTGNEKITSERMLDGYELICDLHDWRPLSKNEDYRQYDENDVLHRIHLFKECGYDWNYGDIGITLIRKDAQPILYKQFQAALYDVYKACHLPHAYSFSYKEMENLYESLKKDNIEIDPKDKVFYENTIWLYNRLEEMRSEIREYMDVHKYRAQFDYEFDGLTLGQLHPDMERFLQTDCYCPGEIYGLDGFGYQLYSIDHTCQVVNKNDKRMAVISRTDNTSYPQCIMFWYDDEDNPGKIINAQRVDATENNIQIVKDIVDGKKPDGRKLDKFKDQTAEMINQIILNYKSCEEI